jgi:mono/diheme cytochrome c family protein
MNGISNSKLRCVALMAALLIGPQIATATEVADSTGEQNYQRFCAACHGETGKGDGPVASAMINGAPDLTKIAQRRDGQFPHEVLRNMIDGRFRIDAHGNEAMPVWGYEFYVTEGAGNFSDRNVDTILDGLVDHLESIQVESAPDGR